MLYSCCVTLITGTQVWVEPSRDTPERAVRGVKRRIQSELPLICQDARPKGRAYNDGVVCVLNWKYVVSVAAFPVPS